VIDREQCLQEWKPEVLLGPIQGARVLILGMEEGKLKKIGLIKLITEFWKVSVFKIENVN